MFASRAALVLAALAGSGAVRAGEAAAEAAAPAEKTELGVYDVRDLTMAVPDFPGPDLTPDSWFSAGGAAPVYAPAPPGPRLTPTSIMDMIRRWIRPASWQPDKGTSIEERAGQLVVVQAPEVHRRIAGLLQSLREQTKVQVSVQGLLLAVGARTAAELRGRRSREFSVAEAEALVRAAGPGGLVAAPQVLCANGQRNHAAALKINSFVSGYDASDGALAPRLATGYTGWVFDVRPILSTAGSAADLELRFTLTGGWQERPVEFSTLVIPREPPPPAVAEGQKLPVREVLVARPAVSFQGKLGLPSVDCWRVRNCVTAPLGRYVLAAAGLPALAGAGGKNGAAGRTAVLLVRTSLVAGKPGPGPLLPDEPQGPGAMVQRTYDTRDLTSALPHFPGPRLGLPWQGAGGWGLLTMAPEPDVTPLTPPALQDMIKRVIEPASWGVNLTYICEQDGQLFVYHTRQVQERIAKCIVEWRAEHKKQLSVQGLVVAADEATAAKLRLRESNQFTPEEAEELVRAAGPGGLLADPQVLGFNCQRVYVSGTRAAGYVSGFDAAGPSVRPRQDLAQVGWVLDVRPTLSVDRKAAELELRFSLADGWQEREAEEKSPTIKCRYGLPAVRPNLLCGVPTVPLGKYVLAGSLPMGPPDAAGGGKKRAAAGRTALVLLKVETVEPEQAKPRDK